MASLRNVLVGTYMQLKEQGWKKTLKTVLTLDQPKVGKLVGVDAHGNEYYENKDELMLRERWVLYKKWNYDASQVPPEWHIWLHRMTDDIPQSSSTSTIENLTGTSSAYVAYNTTTDKIQSWEGKPQRK